MADPPRNRQPLDEQHSVSHSPIELEYRDGQPGMPSESDNFSLFGYSLSVVVAAVFILFIFLLVIALLAG